MNSNWSYSPETVKLGCDLCDLDLWPWPFAWTLLWSLVITPENFMMIRWWEHSKKGVTDRQTDRRKIPFVELLGRRYQKRNTKKWGYPSSWLVIEDGNSTSVYNDSKYLTTSLDWNRATDCNNKPTRRKEREQIAIEKNIRKVTWNTKILKNKSKDRDSNFLVVFSSSKAWRAIERGEGMAHWCWPQFMMDDTKQN